MAARSIAVGVFRSVSNASSFVFTPGRSVDDYLRLAGGPTKDADEDGIFLIRANGSVVSRRQNGGWFRHVDASRQGLDAGALPVRHRYRRHQGAQVNEGLQTALEASAMTSLDGRVRGCLSHLDMPLTVADADWRVPIVGRSPTAWAKAAARTSGKALRRPEFIAANGGASGLQAPAGVCSPDAFALSSESARLRPRWVRQGRHTRVLHDPWRRSSRATASRLGGVVDDSHLEMRHGAVTDGR